MHSDCGWLFAFNQAAKRCQGSDQAKRRHLATPAVKHFRFGSSWAQMSEQSINLTCKPSAEAVDSRIETLEIANKPKGALWKSFHFCRCQQNLFGLQWDSTALIYALTNGNCVLTLDNCYKRQCSWRNQLKIDEFNVKKSILRENRL